MFALPLFAALAAVPLTTYFVSAGGSDSNDGRSPEHAWRSLERVNSTPLHAGDQVMLEGGAQFHGSLTLQVAENGSMDRPIVIGSTSEKRATILSDGTALSFSAGGVVVRDLILKGTATAAVKGQHGLAIRAPETNGAKLDNIQIKDLEISGFGGSGLSIASMDDSHSGFRHVLISNINSHNNYGSGIETYCKTTPELHGYAFEDLQVRNCDCSQNSSGSGIVLCGADGGLVEECRALDNHGEGGGVGIWAWGAKGLTFRHCIAARTRTGGGDGGGFDLDGGCVDCTVEYCLAYENDGPGYMHCDYPVAPTTHDNTIEYSVSINDGRKAKGDNVGVGFVTWGSGLDRCLVKRNLVVVSEKSHSAEPKPVFFVSYVTGGEQPSDVLHVRDCAFEENLALVSVGGLSIIDADEPSPYTEVRFTGDTYMIAPGVTPLFMAGEKLQFGSLTEWLKNLGIESTDKVEPLKPGELSKLGLEAPNYRLTDPADVASFLGELFKAVDVIR